MHENIPRVTIAALRGGSGKTFLSIGLAAAWTREGKKVAPFKKGPDYIDAGWLALASGRHCYNLDTYLCTGAVARSSFFQHLGHADIALVEGNRGLYDGIDLEGHTSTAEIAKLLNSPVLLCIDVTKSTRTIAALVLGCLHFDPELVIGGVILNRVAGARHTGILTRSIEHHTGVPVLGAIPKLQPGDFPERHMGLVPCLEHDGASRSVDRAADLVRAHVNLEGIFDVAVKSAEATGMPMHEALYIPEKKVAGRVKVGIVRDAAFQFYYPENLEALKHEGADLVFVDSMADERLPDVDALYIGGGFPEIHAEALVRNACLRRDIRQAAERGLPIYAECGGLMYLGEALIFDGKEYPMCGVFPLRFGFSKKPQGHGYVQARVQGENPYFPQGMTLRGHEFRYSRVEPFQEKLSMTFFMDRGVGISEGMDGLVFKNTFAAYTHIHALGTPEWAPAFIGKAMKFRTFQSFSR